jgi:DNA polymerase
VLAAIFNPARAKPGDATPFVPARGSLATLREAAQGCRGCPLYLGATQAVLGEGPAKAPLLVVGEQPGDQEDRQGRPFVGPAGSVLDRAMAEAGIDRAAVYVTNAVKHFKFEERGKRRIHKKPSTGEVTACRPWLAAEVARVRPALILCLGGTALASVVGPHVPLLKSRGTTLESQFGIPAVATRHPSSVLRMPDEAGREAAYQELLSDLKYAAKLLKRT